MILVFVEWSVVKYQVWKSAERFDELYLDFS